MTTLLHRTLIQTLTVLLALTLGGLAAPSDSAAQPTDELLRADTTDAVVSVRGMACELCAQSMKQALEEVDAIEGATVRLEDQHALLTLKPNQSVTEEELRTTVTNAGYQFEKVDFSDEEDTSSPGE